MSDTKIYNVWCDGGARGNPGPAGIGFLIKNTEGIKVKQYCEYLGKATNNIAEYTALIRSLEFAKNIGQIDKLNIFMDSELVVKQIKGEYKVKNEGLKPLYLKAKSLLSNCNFSINHVARSDNKEADLLVNKAIDEFGAGEEAINAINEYQNDISQGKLF